MTDQLAVRALYSLYEIIYLNLIVTIVHKKYLNYIYFLII